MPPEDINSSWLLKMNIQWMLSRSFSSTLKLNMFPLSDLNFLKIFVRDLYLDPFLPVEDVELQGIYYDLDKYTVRPESMVVTGLPLYNIMMKHPYIVIEIGSHTDCRASVEYNQKLSENRAKAVTDYLEYRGFPPDRMQAHRIW
jgi:outer membrane protein OmpA-like peptidoglycan-associated protein